MGVSARLSLGAFLAASKPLLGYLLPSFLDQVKVIGRNIMKFLFFSAGPPNFHGFGLCGLAQTKMSAEIALRKITAAAGDFANLVEAVADNSNARPHRIAIALRTHELEIEEMVHGRAAIA